jgi:hypothetical protein
MDEEPFGSSIVKCIQPTGNDSPALSACTMCYGAPASRGGHSCCCKRTGIKEVLHCVPLVLWRTLCAQWITYFFPRSTSQDS